MPNWETTIVPLDDAHELLSALGIGPHSRGYQRWRREDGFLQVDFEGVLNESISVIVVDGRDCLQHVVGFILKQLEQIGIDVSAEMGEDGNEGLFRVDGQSAQIEYVPADEDDFDQVVAVFNRMIADTARYRKFRSCEGSDGWSYVLLKNEDWQTLESAAANTVKLLFV